MITESILNDSFRLILGKRQRELQDTTCRDLLQYLKIVERHENAGAFEIPIPVKLKFDLMKRLLEIIVFDGSLMEFHSTVQHSGRFKQLADYIDLKMSEEMDPEQQEAQEKHIHGLVQLCSIHQKYAEFQQYLETLRDGSYESIGEMISTWSDLIKTTASDVTDYEMKTRGNLVSSFNSRDDDCDAIIREIRKKYSRENVVTSGIPELDTGFLNGGFQPSRIYLWAGTSGIGKSLMMLNQATRAAMSKPDQWRKVGIPTIDTGPEEIYLYITMENFVYETWTRLYCSLFKRTKEEMLTKICSPKTSSADIFQEIQSVMYPYNASLQVEYFPAHSISPANISSLIKEYNKDPMRRVVKAVYVDYLDLLQSDNPKEHYRLELGEITSSLKTIAGNFEIPIITATQLNREAYRRGKNGGLGSDMMSESIQKLFIADFSAMMYREDAGKKNDADQVEGQPTKVNLKIDKNRDGRTGMTHVYFDYPRSRFMTQEECFEEFQETLTV